MRKTRGNGKKKELHVSLAENSHCEMSRVRPIPQVVVNRPDALCVRDVWQVSLVGVTLPFFALPCQRLKMRVLAY